MSESRPSMSPGDAPRAQRTTVTASAASAPTAVPPAAAKSTKAGCGCEGASAAGPSAATALPPALEVASMSAPSLRPGTAGVGAVTATWRSNVHVTGTWSINQDRNCWAYLDAVGWRNLSGTSESGLVSMNMLASHAYAEGTLANCYEGDDGRITQLYVW